MIALASAIGWAGMAVGGAVWLVFELIGVFTKGPTTSKLVWTLENKYPLFRILIAIFVISLGTHFEFHTWLLP